MMTPEKRAELVAKFGEEKVHDYERMMLHHQLALVALQWYRAGMPASGRLREVFERLLERLDQEEPPPPAAAATGAAP